MAESVAVGPGSGDTTQVRILLVVFSLRAQFHRLKPRRCYSQYKIQLDVLLPQQILACNETKLFAER